MNFRLNTAYDAIELCDLIHLEGAKSLATYRSDFYAGRPALTVNQAGSGKAYYVATRLKAPFYDDFYAKLIADLNIERGLETEPACRNNGTYAYRWYSRLCVCTELHAR